MLYKNPDYDKSIENTITIMQYCSRSDPQAARLLYILTTFQSVVTQHRESSQQSSRPDTTFKAIIGSSSGSTCDPIARLFPDHSSSTTSSTLKPSRKNSSTTAVGSGGTRPSPVQHRATMAPPSAPVLAHENSISGLVMSAGISPVGSMAVPASVTDSVSDQAESLGGDAEFDFDTFWSWPSVPVLGTGSGAGMPPEGTTGPLSAASPAIGTDRYDTSNAFGSGPGAANEGSLGSMNAGVPLFSPSHF